MKLFTIHPSNSNFEPTCNKLKVQKIFNGLNDRGLDWDTNLIKANAPYTPLPQFRYRTLKIDRDKEMECIKVRIWDVDGDRGSVSYGW